MRRTAVVVIVLWFFSPMVTLAQTVGTLTAAGSNRLVMDAWPANGWSVKRYENLVEITFPSSGLDLIATADLASSLGPRVEQVQVDSRDSDSLLRLTLTCNCPIAIDGDGANRLTISVIDASQGTQTVRRATGSRPAPDWAPKPPVRPTQSADAEPAGNTDDGVLDVDEARARLLEQLMRAAEAGIVELDPEVAVNADTKPEGEVAPLIDGLAGDEQLVPPDEGVELNEDQAQEGTADDLLANQGKAPTQAEPEALEEAAMASVPTAQCFENSVFAFPEFPKQSDFVDVVSKHRAELIGEFDRADAKVGWELGRAYLSVGMTAEAKGVATDFAADLPETQLIREMASALEGEALDGDASLLKADCDGDQALWRAMALDAGDADAQTILAAELMSGRALERLPVFLREIVAARIGSAAVVAGDWDTARRMEAMAVRAASGRPEFHGETLLLSAQLADWNQELETAWDLRQRALRSGPPTSDEALLQIAETVLASEKFLGASTADLRLDLGSLALQARGSPLGQRAFELEARLMARSRGRDDLIDLLAESERSNLLPEAKKVSLLSELVDDSQLDDLSRPIGLIYLDDPDRFKEAMSQPAFRRAVVRSLAELGLPGLAEPLLQPEDGNDVALLAAVSSSYVTSGDGRSALNVAQEMSLGAERDAAIATALASLGQTQQAAGLLEELSESSENDSRVMALERAVDAAATEGDMETAMSASSKLLQAEPTLERAEEHVMLSLLAGANEMPADALSILQQNAPDRVEKLRTLFTGQSETSGADQQARAEETLERMDVELELLEGLLGDG